jgi:hemin uptake protein HemP
MKPNRFNPAATEGKSESSEGRKPDSVESQVDLPKIVSFNSLARCGEEIWIENNGQIYRLRRTRQGKLILTK